MTREPNHGYLKRSHIRVAIYIVQLAAALVALVLDQLQIPYWLAGLWFVTVGATVVWGELDWMDEQRRLQERGTHRWD
jgi:fatty acid desaturase